MKNKKFFNVLSMKPADETKFATSLGMDYIASREVAHPWSWDFS